MLSQLNHDKCARLELDTCNLIGMIKANVLSLQSCTELQVKSSSCGSVHNCVIYMQGFLFSVFAMIQRCI